MRIILLLICVLVMTTHIFNGCASKPKETPRPPETRTTETAEVRNDWEMARSLDTITGYEEFLEQFPQSDEAYQAHARLQSLYEERDWNLAHRDHTLASYESFLRHHPQSLFAPEARDWLRILATSAAWEIAVSLDAIAAYEEFLEQFPQAGEAALAQERIETLHAELDWEAACRQDTLANYEDFLAKHPESPQAAHARRKIDLYYSRLLSCEQISWIPFNNVEEIQRAIRHPDFNRSEVRDFYPLEMLQECFREQSELLNENWLKTYFELVNELNEINLRLADFRRAQLQIQSLQESVKLIELSLTNLSEIFRTRLKALPEAVIAVSSAIIQPDTSVKEMEHKLIETTKRYLTRHSSVHFVRSNTKSTAYEVVQDIIESETYGTCESFETDPISHVIEIPTINGIADLLYIVHRYRIYIDFPGKLFSYQDEADDLIYDTLHDEFEVNLIGTYSDYTLDMLPNELRLRYINLLTKLTSEIDTFNDIQMLKLDNINTDYITATFRLQDRLTTIKSKLQDIDTYLSSTFIGSNEHTLEQELTQIGQKLNEHVEQREVIVFSLFTTFQSPHMSINAQYDHMVSNMFNDIQKRTVQLSSYRFYRAEDGKLSAWEGSDFYRNPIPIEYALPLKGRVRLVSQGGTYKLGVLLGLRMKFFHDWETGNWNILQNGVPFGCFETLRRTHNSIFANHETGPTSVQKLLGRDVAFRHVMAPLIEYLQDADFHVLGADEPLGELAIKKFNDMFYLNLGKKQLFCEVVESNHTQKLLQVGDKEIVCRIRIRSDGSGRIELLPDLGSKHMTTLVSIVTHLTQLIYVNTTNNTRRSDGLAEDLETFLDSIRHLTQCTMLFDICKSP